MFTVVHQSNSFHNSFTFMDYLKIICIKFKIKIKQAIDFQNSNTRINFKI